MANFKNGTLIGLKKETIYYYYLILSEPRYFGCRWAYAFHRSSEELIYKDEVLAAYGEGFHALIDFDKKATKTNIHIIGDGIDISPFQVDMNLKVRIDKPEGGHEWYIFNQDFQILYKQKKLKETQLKLPVVGGITCNNATKLIDKKWRIEQIVEEEGEGQFPEI